MAGAIVLLLAIVFGLAAVLKLRSREEFVVVLRKLLPSSLAIPVSILIPAGECALAGFLLSGIGLRGALVATLAALSLFTILLIEVRRRGVKGCGCFGEFSEEPNIVSGIVRNLLLMSAAAWLLCTTRSVTIFGPDVSSFLGRITIVIGVLCLWPCLGALTSIRKQISQPSKT